MDIKISFQELEENHSDLIDVLVKKIRLSDMKYRDVQESELEWSYSYGIKIEGGSFYDMLKNVGKKEEPKTTADILNDKLNSVIGLSICVSIGRIKRYVALGNEVKLYPKLFVDKFSEIYMKGVQDIEKENDRLSKLTPEEKEREIQEHINELSDMGGFVGFNLGPNGAQRIQPIKVEYDLDEILDKIGRVGVDGLTAGEKKFLEENSK